jgi:hypothetical protein
MTRPLQPEALTWTGLLGRWIEFAQAALALPDDAEGDRWRRSVPAIINLQAVTFALADLGSIPWEEHDLARDRAEILVRKNAAEMEDAWRSVAMPPELLELLADANSALAHAEFAGSRQLRWTGSDVLVMPALAEELLEGNTGTLALAQPGTLIMPGEPVAWWCGFDGAALAEALPGCALEQPVLPAQIYRQLGDDGHMERDVITAVTDDPEPGLPLLVPLRQHGEPIGRFTVNAERWEQQQRAALPEGASTIPVEERQASDLGDDWADELDAHHHVPPRLPLSKPPAREGE